MICFLTSSPIVRGSLELDPSNRMIEELRTCFPDPCDALFIAAYPNSYERTDLFADSTRVSFEAAGFRFRSFLVLDDRNRRNAAALVLSSNFLILSGGHVPTQNRFFREIGLRELLTGFDGLIMGISAGSMNSAELVYAQPELDGEASDPLYQRFLPGLGLTNTMLLPHYQMIRDDLLDGLRLFEDVAYPDSVGREFYALVDGSYLLIREDGTEELRGEAYRIADGKCTQISTEGETVRL